MDKFESQGESKEIKSIHELLVRDIDDFEHVEFEKGSYKGDPGDPSIYNKYGFSCTLEGKNIYIGKTVEGGDERYVINGPFYETGDSAREMFEKFVKKFNPDLSKTQTESSMSKSDEGDDSSLEKYTTQEDEKKIIRAKLINGDYPEGVSGKLESSMMNEIEEEAITGEVENELSKEGYRVGVDGIWRKN